MNNKVTISDIAEALGISAISVSRALSGQAGVGKDLRDSILIKAKEMGYLKLKNRDDYNILVLHKKPLVQDNSNFTYMVQGLEKALQKAGLDYDMEFVDKANQEEMKLPYKLSKDRAFDGIIFMGKFNDNYVKLLKNKVQHQIFYTGYSPSYECDSVWFNFNNGGYKQCEYLIKKGYKNIGFIGSKSSLFRNKEKVIGIITALEDFEIPVNKENFIYVEEDFDNNFEVKVMELIKKEHSPTAIICQWDFIAVKLINLLHKKGISVPDDISVVGSGNTEMSALANPSLTTLDLNIEYSCEMAVELLLRRINNPCKPVENININSDLIERESVKFFK